MLMLVWVLVLLAIRVFVIFLWRVSIPVHEVVAVCLFLILLTCFLGDQWAASVAGHARHLV